METEWNELQLVKSELICDSNLRLNELDRINTKDGSKWDSKIKLASDCGYRE